MLDKELEVEEEVSTGQTDEGFEVEKEDKLDEVSNVLLGATEDMQKEFADSQNINPEITSAEMVCSVKGIGIETQKAATPELVSEIIDNCVTHKNGN